MNDLKMPRQGTPPSAMGGVPIEVHQLEVAANTDATEEHGEQLHVCERVVISPCAGVFEPTAAQVTAGARIEVGAILGRVSRRDVHSLFAGRFMAMLALPGERIRPGQPVAWLRAE